VKAIIVAGGHGTRLLPMTSYTNKTMLPLNGHPIIDYALSIIRNSGIQDITIIGNKFINKIRNHVGDSVRYVQEEEPKGVAPALQLARSGNENCPLLIWFSDNITNVDLKNIIQGFEDGAVLLTREVDNPEDFGVAIFDDERLIGVVEKPKRPQSNVAIGGIYLFDSKFWNRLDLVQSKPNFSISDVTSQYIAEGSAKVISVGESTWVDCGTPEGLIHASRLLQDGEFRLPEGIE
tara:strand:- start:6479 stop:7183 length:705 start_codon:yes stop_codon:yes gene_type:complete